MLVKALLINTFQNFRSMWQFIKKITSSYVASKHLLEKPKLHSYIKNGLAKHAFFFCLFPQIPQINLYFQANVPAPSVLKSK